MTCIITPYNMAFPDGYTKNMFYIDLLIDFVFLVDVIVNFFFASYDNNFNVIDDPKVTTVYS